MGISRLLGAAELQTAPVADNPRYAAAGPIFYDISTVRH